MGTLSKRVLGATSRTARFALRSATRPWREQRHPEIPTKRPLLPLFAAVFLDELALSAFPRPEIDYSHRELSRAREEMDDALSILEANDCLDDPASFHLTPPPIDDLVREPGKLGPWKFEVLRFNSGYQTLPDMPGLHRWQAMEANCHAQAYVLEHRDGPRPWVLNLHPANAGSSADLLLMRAWRLHRELGYNVLHPVAPLHGERRPQPVDAMCMVFSYDHLNTIHFFSQAVWDVRRLLGWVRSRGATSIAVHGISLGAYFASLLASIEELDRAVIGIGAANLPAAEVIGLSESERSTVEDYGLIGAPSEALQSVVAPSAHTCRVPWENRHIYGGVGDRFAPGGTYELWELWDRPDIHWHRGGHITGVMAPPVWRYVFDSLRG
jgi:hypothetical protein